MGDTWGLLNLRFLCWVDDFGGEFLLCYGKGEETLYANFDDCNDFRVSISNPTPTLPLTIYPDPTTGPLTLTGVDDARRVEVFDLAGRRWLGGTATGNTLDLSGLPAGVYTVRVIDGEGAWGVARVVRR